MTEVQRPLCRMDGRAQATVLTGTVRWQPVIGVDGVAVCPRMLASAARRSVGDNCGFSTRPRGASDPPRRCTPLYLTTGPFQCPEHPCNNWLHDLLQNDRMLPHLHFYATGNP